MALALAYIRKGPNGKWSSVPQNVPHSRNAVTSTVTPDSTRRARGDARTTAGASSSAGAGAGGPGAVTADESVTPDATPGGRV